MSRFYAQTRKFHYTAVLTAFFLTSQVLQAQTLQGSLSGAVTDASGAITPGARVIAVHMSDVRPRSTGNTCWYCSAPIADIGQTYSATTNAAGIFSLLNLPNGNYSLTITASGLKPYAQNGIEVTANAITREDVTLLPGKAVLLYNGIRLPAAWPPVVSPLTREIQTVPYLLSPPDVINIDTGRQLFVDDFLIQKTTLKRTFHHPTPYAGNPVLTSDRPWESGPDKAMAAPFSDGVWYDPKDSTFKMWYMCSQHKSGTADTNGIFTCYATSSDGLHWKKPSLDVVPGTNIVLATSRDSTVVWLDQREKDPSRRFKLFLSHPNAAGQWGASVYYSPDGIHWGEPIASNNGLFGWVGDRNTVFFNPFRDVWVYSIRDKKPYPGVGRMRYYSESADLAAGLEKWQPLPWVGADQLDLRNPNFPQIKPELYSLDATPYESLMVGLFSVWEGPENKICAEKHIQKRNQVMLGYSRDGFHWDRPDRQPFLAANETEGAWNWGNMQSVGGGFLVVGDNLYFYSSGRKRNDQSWDGDASTGLFILRRDGFASMDAGNRQSSLTTRLVVFSGKELFVNFETDGGQLRAEVLDEAGNPIAPFTAKNCLPIRKGSTRQAIHWRDGSDLSALIDHHVRFRFLVTHGSLYSFWVSQDASGASGGYIAGGGPACDETRESCKVL